MLVFIVSRGYPSPKYKFNGIFEYDQARALQKAGCKVILLAVDLRSIRRWRNWGIEHMFQDGIDIYTLNIPLGRIPHYLLKFWGIIGTKKLYKIAIQRHGVPDVIHCHFMTQAEITISLKQKTSKPVFVTTQHEDYLLRQTLEMPNWVQCHAKEILAQYHAVIAVSPGLASHIKQCFGINAIYAPNVVDTSIFGYQYRYIMNDKFFDFVFVGTLEARKCPVCTIRAFHEAFISSGFMTKDGQKIRLIVVGNGPEYYDCKNTIDQLALNDYVIMQGQLQREEIAKIFYTSSIFILPSRRETFGVVYIEAMACGLPVIATKCGGPELFVNETNGVLIPVDDQDALANSFRFMLNNAGKYDRENIANETKNKFSPDAVAEQIIAIYRGLINANSSKESLI